MKISKIHNNTYSSLRVRPVKREAQVSYGTANNIYVSTDLKADDRKNPEIEVAEFRSSN